LKDPVPVHAGVARAPQSDRPSWVSVSDLAEYAYCPRAQWYRAHPPDAPPSRAAVRSAERGAVYHDRRLSAVRGREARGPGWGIGALALGLLLIVGLAILWFA
jgi:hypothetical protein